MSENPIQLWLVVNGYMQDEYRETVVDLALRHLPHASRNLHAFAKRELSQAVTVPGFRSFHRTPADVALPHVVKQMQQIPGVATAVICLWAEAEQQSISDLQAAAETKGLEFHSDWTWQQAQHGFYDFEDVVPLKECTEALAQEKTSPESDHIWLAALWLSRALISQLPKVVTRSSPLHVQETQTDETQQSVGDSGAGPRGMTSVRPCELAVGPSREALVGEIKTTDLEETLPTLYQSLQEYLDKVGQAQQAAVAKSQAVLASIETSDIANAENQLSHLRDALNDWKSELGFLKKAVQWSTRRISSEFSVRPDLDLDTSIRVLLSEEDSAAIAPEAAAPDILSAITHIYDYDREKQDILNQLDQVQANIAKLRDDVVEWIQDELVVDDVEDTLYLENDGMEVTLSDAQATLDRLAAEQHELENRRSQLRGLSLNRIAVLTERLQELDLSIDTVVSDNLTLGTLVSSNIADWTGRRLGSIEQKLASMVDEQTMIAKLSGPETLAAELQSEWDEDKLVSLLNRLAKEKRDVEALLLLLAANTAHPRTTTIVLERTVVSSLLRGVGQFSKKARPFELLNLLAPDFLNGWNAADPVAQAELCLIFLAAQYGGGRQLPDEFLWYLGDKWPVDEMSNWNRLWQSALLDEPLPIIITAQGIDWANRLEQARSRASQMLSREHGRFVRLNSLKSKRHQAMLGSEIMPDLFSQLGILQKAERDLEASSQYDLTRLLAQLDNLLAGKLTEALDEDTLTKAYEAGVAKEDIHDSDPFHSRSALRILKECAETILDYGKALVEFWRTNLQDEASVTRQALQAELQALPELTSLGQAALEQIVQSASTELPRRDKAVAISLASRQLVYEILSQATCASSLPRIVGYLSGARLDWIKLLGHLLDDLVEPVNIADAATLLLEQEAPNQVLLLTQHVTLDIQKQAQSLERDKEQEIDILQTELLKVGGSAEDLLSDRELGRWRFVHQKLVERLDEYQMVYESEKQQRQERSLQLRRAVYDLDQEIFKSKGTMPADAYRLIERGLNLAKKATEMEALFGQAGVYLKEVRYRLEHQSWPLAELQDAVNQLKRAVDGETVPDVELGIEKVLDLLEREELRQLNINPDEIAASEVGTRCDLLRNWLAVRELSTLMSEDLKVADRAAIQSLFRYFAQMVAMKRFRSESDGQPIIYEYPFVYSYWELRYPRTDVLDERCIFVALPGNPPTARDLSHLEYRMEDKEWLEFAFVLLFVPGCTPKMYDRLHSHYQGEGLVIIDESVILSMVLAEAKSNKPLGRLRPMMLRALDAENIDVFKINQLVPERTAIFVGRDALIRRIVSSGDNYAVYGGRRIGKSSVLMAVKDRLERRGTSVVLHSFEGDYDCSDDAGAINLARGLKLESDVKNVGDFKLTLQARLDTNPESNLVLMLDEIDRYIEANPERHVLIESLRALSDRCGSQFRVVIAGFMSLYDCLHGRGPYTPASDPWVRMLNDIGPLPNLRPRYAEQIVREGFVEILGWEFKNRAIPPRIVERTGGHPAFAQKFCQKLQQRVGGSRNDRLIRLEDVEAIFDDRDPEQSFIAYVRKTLELNLDPIGRFLIPWLAAESSDAQSFTLAQMRELAQLSELSIPEGYLSRSVERLSVTSVVKARAPEVYDFSVPDYPSILDRLGGTAHLAHLENELEKYLRKEE